jgi:hypothetical protein
MFQSRRSQSLVIVLTIILIAGTTFSFAYFSNPIQTQNPQTPDTPKIPTPTYDEINLIGEINTGGYALSVHVDGDLAFVIDFGDSDSHGLVIVNVSDPMNPEIIGTYHAGGFPFAIESIGEIVYIADEFEGLRIINISDPTNPLEIEGYTGSGMAFDLEIVGNYLFMADYEYGLVILDISVPSNPVYVASYGPDCVHLDIEDDIAYVAGHGRLRVLNVSNPHNPTLLGQTLDSSITLWDPSVSNGTIYLANHSGDDGEILIFDARNPINIEQIAEFDSIGTFQSFFVQDPLLFAVDFESGLYIIDVTNSTSPVEIGRFSEGQPWDVTICNDLVYLVGSEGLQILQVTYT